MWVFWHALQAVTDRLSPTFPNTRGEWGEPPSLELVQIVFSPGELLAVMVVIIRFAVEN